MGDLNLTKTKDAVAAYDVALTAFQAGVSVAPLNESERLLEAVQAAEEAVRDAFAEETADRNQPKNARLVHPSDPWLRRLVEKYTP